MIPNFVTIGHITQDLLPGGDYTPGGTVSFGAVTARNLGERAAIVTNAPAFIRSLPVFEGIEIAGRETAQATVFENIYTPEGRVQYIRSVAPVIGPEDVPSEWVGPGKGVEIVHLGPVAQECGPDLISLFPDALFGITPQGFMREWDELPSRVRPILWEGEKAHAILSRVTALVLSEEDLPRGPEGRRLLGEYISACPVVAFTQEARGCTIFCEGKAIQVPAYPAKVVDPTGAGDVFAAAFFIRLQATDDPIEAARFANAAAGCNIEGPGLAGVPTLEQVYQRMKSPPR